MSDRVSWVLPTVDGRAESCARSAIYPNAHPDVDVIELRNRPTCGQAWVDGAEQAVGEYIYFAADDIEAHDGFVEAMAAAVDAGTHPAALVLMPNGSKQSCGGTGGDVCRGSCQAGQFVEWSPTPFIRRDWWEWIEPHATMLARLHYSTDRLVSAILAQHGIPSIFTPDAVITHHNEPAGRLWTAGGDGATFEQYWAQVAC